MVFSEYSTNKTDRKDIAEILSKVAFNTITLTHFRKVLVYKLITHYKLWNVVFYMSAAFSKTYVFIVPSTLCVLKFVAHN